MNEKTKYKDTVFLSVGELAVAGLTVLGAFIASLFTDYIFNYSAILGALLGAAVIIANFLFLTISVNSAVDSYLKIRGSREMSEEEAEKFTQENSMVIQNKIKVSFIIRTLTMLGTLILAFITGWFNPLCTAIPMLMFRPLVYISEAIKGKDGK